ncbi:MAG: hypothetical protein RJA70_3198 [Pseudomonadota bacterium]|jgi:hypothetical protein
MKITPNRRLFLRGAGSVLIGLPLLEEFAGNTAYAQAEAVPQRVLTLSFGLGIDQALQSEKFLGPLAPFQKIGPKAAFFSNLSNGGDLTCAGIVHRNNGAVAITGVKQKSDDEAGGPSLEQRFLKALHPGVVPTVGGLASKSAGLWSRGGGLCQVVRSWNENGSPGEIPVRRPSAVFDSIFGNIKPGPGPGPGPTPDPAAAIQSKIDRSVLDSVMAEFTALKGPRSYLGAQSKARIDGHLSAIREVENQLVPADTMVGPIVASECKVPAKAADPELSFYDVANGSNPGPTVPWQDAQTAFRLNADMVVLAMSCDALRFGSMLFTSCGEQLRFQGTHTALGKTMDFTETFANVSPHEAIIHNYVVNDVRIYMHYVLSQLAYVVDQMDAVIEPNGKTLLDNTLVTVSTEYGHSHESTGIFGAVIGGNGKFKPGQYDAALTQADVIASILKAYGLPGTGTGTEISGLLV